MQEDFLESASFEHRFWLQVLGDHSRFIFSSLSPKEVESVQRAASFVHSFDALLTEARRTLGREELTRLSRNTSPYVMELRHFKLDLLERQLVGKVLINLSPTFLNHMVNELDEYVRILQALGRGEIPRKMHPVHHHLLWLSDAAGHAATLTAMFDPAEKGSLHKSKDFSRRFEHLYLKAVEMAGYLRTRLSHFPALSRFNREAELEIKLFQAFLAELEEMRVDYEVLGTLQPLMADHMFREECYYLLKLSRETEVKKPECDPAKPRAME